MRFSAPLEMPRQDRWSQAHPLGRPASAGIHQPTHQGHGISSIRSGPLQKERYFHVNASRIESLGIFAYMCGRRLCLDEQLGVVQESNPDCHGHSQSGRTTNEPLRGHMARLSVQYIDRLAYRLTIAGR